MSCFHVPGSQFLPQSQCHTNESAVNWVEESILRDYWGIRLTTSSLAHLRGRRAYIPSTEPLTAHSSYPRAYLKLCRIAQSSLKHTLSLYVPLADTIDA